MKIAKQSKPFGVPHKDTSNIERAKAYAKNIPKPIPVQYAEKGWRDKAMGHEWNLEDVN